MNKFSYIFTGIFAIILASSCSDYNQVLKSDDYGEKFDMANYLYDSVATSGAKVRSISLYEQIYQRSPKTGEGELSYFRIGKAYYLSGDYYMAGYYLGQFPQRFPFSAKAEESTFLSAMCSVNNSPDWSLDQLETDVAINNLQQFVNRYPNSTLIDSCNNIIDGLRFKLETKAFESVRLYSKTENYRAAESSALTFLEDYPMSGFKEEVHYLLVLNSFYLAKNSVEKKKKERIEQTIERYSTFVAAFPDSKYVRTLASYDDSMRGELREY
ncbi:MAG: outer membrane protein assembly factor BamD [Crocinitomicaceae bacterium]